MRYDDASNTGSMAADSAPTARPDVDFLPQGDPGPATGNAITGAGTTSGAAGADMVGDAPARIVEVNGAGGPAAASGNSFQASGQYGVLTMDAQGNFSYVRNGGTPDGVQDVFGYTLADRDGSTSSTTLTVEHRPRPHPGGHGCGPGRRHSSAGRRAFRHPRRRPRPRHQHARRHADGDPGGAVFVPQLVIGDVEVPATNLAALLIDSEPQPAAGPLPSSGGNFAGPVPPLDPGVPLGDLIPPTELDFTPPEFEEPGQFLDRDPEIIIDPVDRRAVGQRGLRRRRSRSSGAPARAGRHGRGSGRRRRTAIPAKRRPASSTSIRPTASTASRSTASW